jgi:hypothetical protein
MAALQSVEHGVIVKLEYTLQIEDELVEPQTMMAPLSFYKDMGRSFPG